MSILSVFSALASYGYDGFGWNPRDLMPGPSGDFAFRTPNQRKRRKLQRQMGSRNYKCA